MLGVCEWILSGRFSPLFAQRPLAPTQAFSGMSAHRSAPAHPISARSAPFSAPFTCSAVQWFPTEHVSRRFVTPVHCSAAYFEITLLYFLQLEITIQCTERFARLFHSIKCSIRFDGRPTFITNYPAQTLLLNMLLRQQNLRVH